MIPYRDALRIVLENTSALGSEEVLLTESQARVLAEDIVSDLDIPPFDNSSVDGYALRAEDASGPLRLIGEVPAGTMFSGSLGPGEAVRIFTGSPIPQGANAVAMQEDVRRVEERISIDTPGKAGDFIRRRGGEVQRGTAVLSKGAVVSPPVAGLLASLGIASIPVVRRPKVAIVGTGSELAAPGQPLRPGQIYEANSVALRQVIEGLGLEVVTCRLVQDDFDRTKAALAEALHADVVLTSGGVSVGDHDLVRRALQELDVEEKLWRVAMRPGKPFYFGVAPSGARVFGLPGNPVSALVTFYVLVRPALAQMVGITLEDLRRSVPLAGPISQRGDRADFLRAREVGGRAEVSQAQESHMLSGLAGADLLLYLPEFSGPYQEGDIVEAIPLRWNSFT